MIKRSLALVVSVAFAGSIALPLAASANPLVITRSPGSVTPIGAGVRHNFPFVPAALTRIGARYIGPATLTRPLEIHVQTQLRNEAGLHAYAQAASTPGSLYYRHWLNPVSIATTFGTPLAQYDAAAAYFASYGLTVKTWKTRTSLTVTGKQSQIEAALATKLGMYNLHGSVFYGITKAISVPSNIAVAGISSLTNAHLKHTHSLPGGPPEPISGGFANARVNGVTPAQLAEAYNLNEAYEKGYTGQGINLGIIGTGPISLYDGVNYKTLFQIGGSSTISIVPGDQSGDSTPPPVTGPCSSGSSTAPVAGCNPEDLEAQLDTEQTVSLAKDSNILFFLAYNASADEQGLDESDDEFNTAIDENTADILSYSVGGCEYLNDVPGIGALTLTPGGDATGSGPTEFAELASEGVAIFVSSGDSGSAGCQELTGMLPVASVEYPSSDPNVVAVGGTTTPLGPNGRLIGPITNWGPQTQSDGAAGAGISTDFVEPAYQKAQAASNAICSTGRCVPDVALDADPFTGASVLEDSGPGLGGAVLTPVGGTSQAAPDMASVWAIILSACKQVTSCHGPAPANVIDPQSGFTAPASPSYRMGNPNFLLYPILSQGAYSQDFYDITYGSDGIPSYEAMLLASEGGPSAYGSTALYDPGAVSAGVGYDNASGLGFPSGYALLKQLIPGAN